MGAALEKCVAQAQHTEGDEEDDDAINPENPVATFDLAGGVTGKIKVELFLDRVPLTASNFIALAQDQFYDGLHFHRVRGVPHLAKS